MAMGSFSILSWLILLSIFAAIGGIVYVLLRAQKTGPYGIGGWLILPIIGFIGTLILTGINIVAGLGEIEGLKAIMLAADGPLAQLRLPVIASIVAGIMVMLSAGLCLYLIFKKDARIIFVATIHYVILACGSFADLWADAALRVFDPTTPPDPSVVKEAGRGIMIAAIWIPYFRISKRVKNTFVLKSAQIEQAAVTPALTP